MIFTKESPVVQAWVRGIQSGGKTIEEVPNLSNLRSVVAEALEGGETHV
ncbi:hypothetical protein [Aneurinibacillus sp. REN35]